MTSGLPRGMLPVAAAVALLAWPLVQSDGGPTARVETGDGRSSERTSAPVRFARADPYATQAPAQAPTPSPLPTTPAALPPAPITSVGTATGAAPLLASRGGPVLLKPRVYAIYWGPEWSTGFSSAGTTSAQSMAYLNAFLSTVGDSAWLGAVTEYCMNVPNLTTDCTKVAGATYVSRPTAATFWGGSWIDPTPVPASPAWTDVADAAARGVAHFGYNPGGTYVVLAPAGKGGAGFGITWCGSHGQATGPWGTIPYANIPYIPDAGAGCGMGFVNKASNAFGNGLLDGYSALVGHELVETITDPLPGKGWLDEVHQEASDKCSFIPSGQGAAANITLGGLSFAVQSIFSNRFNGGLGGCVLPR